jgi:hypothetical protein
MMLLRYVICLNDVNIDEELFQKEEVWTLASQCQTMVDARSRPGTAY